MGMKLGTTPRSLATLGKRGRRVWRMTGCLSATASDRCCKNSLRRLAMADRIGPRSNVATASRTGPRSTWIPLETDSSSSPLPPSPRPRPSAIPPTTALIIPPPPLEDPELLLLLLLLSLLDSCWTLLLEEPELLEVWLCEVSRSGGGRFWSWLSGLEGCACSWEKIFIFRLGLLL